MADDLEERLKSHARAFEGLMSLIPAKHYYGEDTSDQWQRKKQTKKQKREARRAKLDPNSYKSAKDVMDENERKRKRQSEVEDDSEIEAEGMERPQEGLKAKGKKAKMLKLNGAWADKGKVPKAEQDDAVDGVEAAPKKTKSEKRREKKQRKEKKAKEKAETGKARKEAVDAKESVSTEQDNVVNSDGEDVDTDEIGKIDVSGLAEDDHVNSHDNTPSTPVSESEDTKVARVPSSSRPKRKRARQGPQEETEVDDSTETQAQRDAMKAKLQAQIKELRAQRKADSVVGKSGQNKQKVIEARRRKEELKKAARKELRKEVKGKVKSG